MQNKTVQLRKKVIEAAEKADNEKMLQSALQILSGDHFIMSDDEAAAVAAGLADIEAGRTHTNEEVNAFFDKKMAEWDNAEG